MPIRKDQELRLRREVKDIVTEHIRHKAIDKDNLIEDIMGAVNQEDNYRMQDYRDGIDKQRVKMIHDHETELASLRTTLEIVGEERDKYKAKCSDTHKDAVIKEMEHKLGRANEKVSILKRLAKVFMEEI